MSSLEAPDTGHRGLAVPAWSTEGQLLPLPTITEPRQDRKFGAEVIDDPEIELINLLEQSLRSRDPPSLVSKSCSMVSFVPELKERDNAWDRLGDVLCNVGDTLPSGSLENRRSSS